jgi:hypothetical protein
MEFRRRLYSRGSSFETTIPRPLLFSLNPEEKHDVVFNYDEEQRRWYVEIVPKSGTKQGIIKKEDKNQERALP